MRRLVVAIGLLLLATARPAVAGTTYEVGEAASQFRNGACPAPAGNNITTIRAGDSVRWTNCDSYDHDIVWDTPGRPDPPLQEPNQSVVQTFPRAGFFDYHCQIHPAMTGRVIVQPAASSSTTQVTAPPSTTTTAPNLTTTSTAPSPTTTLPNAGATTTSSSAPPSTTSTTADTSSIRDKDRGASGLVVGLTLVGIAAAAGGTVVVVRRMRGGS